MSHRPGSQRGSPGDFAAARPGWGRESPPSASRRTSAPRRPRRAEPRTMPGEWTSESPFHSACLLARERLVCAGENPALPHNQLQPLVSHCLLPPTPPKFGEAGGARCSRRCARSRSWEGRFAAWSGHSEFTILLLQKGALGVSVGKFLGQSVAVSQILREWKRMGRAPAPQTPGRQCLGVLLSPDPRAYVVIPIKICG